MAEMKITKSERTEMGISEMTVEVKDIEITADMVTSLFGREKKSSESGAWQRTIEQKENNEKLWAADIPASKRRGFAPRLIIL